MDAESRRPFDAGFVERGNPAERGWRLWGARGVQRGRRIAVPLGPSGEDAVFQINNGDLNRGSELEITCGGNASRFRPTRAIF